MSLIPAFYELVRKNSIFLVLIRVTWVRRVIGVFPQKVSYRLLKRLGPINVPISVGRARIVLTTSSDDDHYMSAMAKGLRGWETESLRVWATLCSEAKQVVDVGAYSGIYSLVAARLGRATVLAFEPNDLMFDRLVENIENNKLGGRVIPRRLALSNSVGRAKLLVPRGREMSSGARLDFTSPAIGLEGIEWVAGVEVAMNTLDSELEANGLSQVSVIKVDAEGAELGVLMGAERLLRSSKPALIVECIGARARDEVAVYLSTFGYRLVRELDRDSSKGSIEETASNRAANFLFE